MLERPRDEDEYEGAPVWMRQRKCGGVEADPTFFYPNGGNGRVQQAKRFCKGTVDGQPCPVMDECLDYALENGEKFGVWGGTSERERRRLKKKWLPPPHAQAV